MRVLLMSLPSLDKSLLKKDYLDCEIAMGSGMLSIKPMVDAVFTVNNIQNEVSVVLNGSSKNDNFIIFCHFFQEGFCVRPHQKLPSIF